MKAYPTNLLPREECAVTRYILDNVVHMLDAGNKLVAVGHYAKTATVPITPRSSSS